MELILKVRRRIEQSLSHQTKKRLEAVKVLQLNGMNTYAVYLFQCFTVN